MIQLFLQFVKRCRQQVRCWSSPGLFSQQALASRYVISNNKHVYGLESVKVYRRTAGFPAIIFKNSLLNDDTRYYSISQVCIAGNEPEHHIWRYFTNTDQGHFILVLFAWIGYFNSNKVPEFLNMPVHYKHVLYSDGEKTQPYSTGADCLSVVCYYYL